jgi:hypothetical protein
MRRQPAHLSNRARIAWAQEQLQGQTDRETTHAYFVHALSIQAPFVVGEMKKAGTEAGLRSLEATFYEACCNAA